MAESDWVSQELKRSLGRATRAGHEAARREPRARHARYLPRRKAIEVGLGSGAVIVVPVSLIPPLAEARPSSRGRISVGPGGFGLHWPDLDLDLSVPQLLVSLVGSAVWLAELGRRGGSSMSAAKREAARRNGIKGGRPRRAEGRAARSG